MGKYLQKYDYRWNCWLFPYIKTAENNKENVDEYISELFHLSIDTSYIAQAKHCKYSESDNVYKIYNHKLYGVLLTHTPEIMLQDEFYMEDVKYRWMSIKELEQDENVMKKNADVIAFINRNICNKYNLFIRKAACFGGFWCTYVWILFT